MKKQTIKISVLAILLLCVLLVVGYSIATATENPNKLKVHARITGNVCEFWGTNPNKQEGSWVVTLVTADKMLDSNSQLLSGDIAWVGQCQTGKNGSFSERCKLMTDRMSTKSKMYLYVNSEGMTKCDPVEIDVLPVSGTLSDVQSNSIRVGMDVYEATSSGLTADNILDSIKNGGTQLMYKLGNNWYNLLDDKCTSSDYLIPEHALSGSDLEALSWAKYYRGGDADPTYFN